MRKKIFMLVAILLTGGLIWYLFLKPYDYLVSFQANTFAGTTAQELKLWAKNLENSELIPNNKLDDILIQKLKFGDSLHTYKWELTTISDSLTKVKVYVTDEENSLHNKLTIPFEKTEFEKQTEKTVTNFVNLLKEHIANFKISSIDTVTLDAKFCAYISIETTQMQKASKMMFNYPILDGFLYRNELKPAGSPFIQITKWDRTNDSIAYDFCYPIIKVESLPSSPTIKFREFKKTTGLKAIYNGNYITSDRAWYALLAWAKKREVEVIEKPIEIFHSNPNFGGNELEWEAEILMPLK